MQTYGKISFLERFIEINFQKVYFVLFANANENVSCENLLILIIIVNTRKKLLPKEVQKNDEANGLNKNIYPRT